MSAEDFAPSLMSAKGEIRYNEGKKMTSRAANAEVMSERHWRTRTMPKYTTTNCVVCGKEFTAETRKRQQVCGYSCSNRRRVTPRNPIHQPDTNTYLIPLTKGYYATVDACDIDLAQFNWSARVTKDGQVYAQRYITRVANKQQFEQMHRTILERKLGRPLDARELVDHIRGGGLVNTRDNLRTATPLENSANQKLSKANTSGYKGVSWSRKAGLWRAAIHHKKKCIVLGLYSDPADAHAAYLAAAKIYHAEFANGGDE